METVYNHWIVAEFDGEKKLSKKNIWQDMSKLRKRKREKKIYLSPLIEQEVFKEIDLYTHSLYRCVNYNRKKLN